MLGVRRHRGGRTEEGGKEKERGKEGEVDKIETGVVAVGKKRKDGKFSRKQHATQSVALVSTSVGKPH